MRKPSKCSASSASRPWINRATFRVNLANHYDTKSVTVISTWQSVEDWIRWQESEERASNETRSKICWIGRPFMKCTTLLVHRDNSIAGWMNKKLPIYGSTRFKRRLNLSILALFSCKWSLSATKTALGA